MEEKKCCEIDLQDQTKEQVPAHEIVPHKIKFKVEGTISVKGSHFTIIKRLDSPGKYNNFKLVCT